MLTCCANVPSHVTPHPASWWGSTAGIARLAAHPGRPGRSSPASPCCWGDESWAPVEGGIQGWGWMVCIVLIASVGSGNWIVREQAICFPKAANPQPLLKSHAKLLSLLGSLLPVPVLFRGRQCIVTLLKNNVSYHIIRSSCLATNYYKYTSIYIHCTIYYKINR